MKLKINDCVSFTFERNGSDGGTARGVIVKLNKKSARIDLGDGKFSTVSLKRLVFQGR